MSRIAVVVPAHNAGKYLARTLQSAQAQTLSEWQMVIVDDGSTDDTAQIAQQFAASDLRIRVLRQAQQGVSAARNAGWAASSASAFLVFLDADDVWEPDALKVLVDALDACPEAVAAHGCAHFIDEAGRDVRVGEQEAYARERYMVAGRQLKPVGVTEPTAFAALVWQNCIPTCGIVLRRAAADRAGGFDPAFSHAEDWEMWLRVSLQGSIAFCDRVVYSYRLHPSNASVAPGRMRAAQRRVRLKLLNRGALQASEWRMALTALWLAERHAAADLARHAARQWRQRRPLHAVNLVRLSVAARLWACGQVIFAVLPRLFLQK